MANNRILVEDHKEATRRLGTLEQKYQDKKDECNSLRIKQVSQTFIFLSLLCITHRLQATEVQVAQYQAEITGLEKAHLQLDEYKKRSDAKSK